ncbi:hypothetical protein RSAG8_11019, partial [Rhizoctonia solani AG-8 WAC10335]
MCGRFALHNFHIDRVRDEYPNIPPRRWDDEEQFHPRYNVAPQTNVPVIMREPNGQGQQELVVRSMRWGLQARWCDPNTFSFKNPINARSEVVLDGSAAIWRSVRGAKHCIVVCDGYYEWLKKGSSKAPHYVKHPQDLLLLAGFYEIVKGTDPPRTTYTCTILTTEANSQLAFLHDRMPVILSGEQALEWLDVEKGWRPEVLEELRKPYGGKLVCYEVPPGVGKVGNEDPSFVEPLAKKKGGIEAMMGRMGQRPKREEDEKIDLVPKREPSEAMSDGLDIKEEEMKPKVEPSPKKPSKEEHPTKTEPEEIVLDDDSDVEEDTTRVKSSPRSSPTKRRAPFKRGSSPIEIDLVNSESEGEKVPIDTDRKKRKVNGGPSPPREDKKPARPMQTPSKKTITDFFKKK